METGIEEETIAGLMEDVDKTDRPSAGTHDHIPSTALDAGERLKQLEDLKKAGSSPRRSIRKSGVRY